MSSTTIEEMCNAALDRISDRYVDLLNEIDQSRPASVSDLSDVSFDLSPYDYVAVISTASWSRYSVTVVTCTGQNLTFYAENEEQLVQEYAAHLANAVTAANIALNPSHPDSHARVVIGVARAEDGTVKRMLHSGEWSCQEGHVAT